MTSTANPNGATETEPDADKLSNLERLILVQAVYEFGNGAWPEVSKLLNSHPMLSHSEQHFTPAFCNAVYLQLMQDARLECPANSRKVGVHRQLAKIHYDKRVEEVRSLLLAEESKFRKIVGEIDDIRAGRWDNRILGKDGSETLDVDDAPVEGTEEVKENPEIIVVEDEPTVVSEQADVEPPVAESTHIDVQDEIAEVDIDVQPEPSSPAEAEDHTLEEDEIMAEEEAPAEAVGEVLAEEEIVPQEIVTSEVKADSRGVSPAISIRDEHMEDAEQLEEDVPPEEKVANVEKVEQPDEAVPQSEESPGPDVKVKDEPELEVEAEAEAEAEVEMVMASDGEQSTRTDGKRKASEALSEPPRERKRAREDSEPVDEDEPGPSTNKSRRKAQAPDKKFQNVIGMLHSTISQHRYGNIFHNPIKKSEAPDYHDIVKRPMDLKTIKARVKDGLISNSLEFQRDIYLMFANAMMYNRPGSDVHNMAEEMMLESEFHINTFRQTEGFHRS